MSVNFSKMTAEKYQRVLNARNMINDGKSDLALLLVEIEAFADTPEGKEMKAETLELLKKFDKFNVDLMEYEL